MTSVLITGSTGFVGGNLVDHLYDKGFGIYTLDRAANTNPKIKQGYTWDNFGACDLQNINAIIHLAGKAHDTKNTADPAAYFTINTGLLKTIFDLFVKSPATDLIYFSSVKAVADNVPAVLYEDAPYEAKTPYGQSKQQAEEYILRQLPIPGKRVVILRPCMVHGPGNKGNLNLLYKFVAKNIPYPLAAFDNLRSFLSIDNLTYMIERLLTSPGVPGGIYNVADDEALSTTDVINTIGIAGNVKVRLWKLSPTLITTLAKIGDVLHLPLNSERLKKLTESYVVANQKIKKALNINKLPVSAVDGLTKTIKSFHL